MNYVDDASCATLCGNTCYKVEKKQVITEKGKHMDLYFTTCKLKVVEKQGVANIQVVFVEIQVNFNKH